MNFEKLEVYQKAIELACSVYRLTKHWPKADLYGLTIQLQRAALSVPLNIAEGSSRSRKDFAHFLTISRGSCYECIALITIAFKRDLLSEIEYQELRATIEQITKMTNGLRSALMKPL